MYPGLVALVAATWLKCLIAHGDYSPDRKNGIGNGEWKWNLLRIQGHYLIVTALYVLSAADWCMRGVAIPSANPGKRHRFSGMYQRAGPNDYTEYLDLSTTGSGRSLFIPTTSPSPQ